MEVDFVRYSDTLRSKLHLGGYRLPVLIGSMVAALLVAILILSNAVKALTAPTISINTSQSSASQEQSPTESEPKTAFVHVGGAVCAPGLYELAEGSRVQQAISMAGGFTETANTDALNLARQVTDGEQIIVPEQQAAGESQGSGSSTSSGASSSVSASSTSATDKVNINTATSEMLQTLKGIGPSMAQKIIDDRTANGPYKTIEDLKRVSGIGDKKFAAISANICVG